MPRLLYEVTGKTDAASIEFGHGISGIGDVDGDGFGDFSVGTYLWNSGGSGYVRIYSGRDGLELYTIYSSSIRGSNRDAPVVTSSHQDLLGDVDGDQVPDFFFVNGFGDPNPAHVDGGLAKIISGKTGKVIRTHLPPIDDCLYYGRGLAITGDLDGDGVKDYSIGCDRWWGHPATFYSGSSGNPILTIEHGSDTYVSNFLGVDDLNEDGVSDIVFTVTNNGAASSNPPAKLVFISGLLRGNYAPDSIPEDKVLMRYERESFDDFWTNVLKPIGDVDGDGFIELARVIWPRVKDDFGRYEYADQSILSVMSTGTGKELWRSVIFQTRKGGRFRSFETMGDVNGDGVSDFLVLKSHKEGVRVVSGPNGSILASNFESESPSDAGENAGVIGDLNGDGALEIAFTKIEPNKRSVGVYSYGRGPVDYLDDTYIPRLSIIEEEGETIIAWPPILKSVVVEKSEDLIAWTNVWGLLGKEPDDNRWNISSDLKSGALFFRIRYEPFDSVVEVGGWVK